MFCPARGLHKTRPSTQGFFFIKALLFCINGNVYFLSALIPHWVATTKPTPTKWIQSSESQVQADTTEGLQDTRYEIQDSFGGAGWSGTVFLSLQVKSCTDVRVSSWPHFVCSARTQMCAHVKDPWLKCVIKYFTADCFTQDRLGVFVE